MTSILLKSPPLNAPTVCQLTNGLTIVAEQMPIEAVNLSIWLNVGSAVESDQINGMAHFLEHMVFKGTKNLASGEFERLVEERGAVTNAATSQDYTQFYITTAPKDFADLAPLQIDVVLNPSIPDEAFERERLVVLEEIRRAEDNPRRRTYQRSIETAFTQLPYRRPVLGPTSVIESLVPQQMRDFHNGWYQPQSITAAVVGNLPVEQLIEIVAESFTQHHSNLSYIPESCAIPEWQPEEPFREIVRREYVDESLQQARLIMLWRVPGMTELSQTYPLDILAAILGQGRSSRLVRDLRENRRLVTNISASNSTHNYQGIFQISAHVSVENIAEVELAIAEHIRNLQTAPVTKAEISRVRTQVANRFVFASETPSDRAGMYGYYQSMVKHLDPMLNYPAIIQAVNEEELQLTANSFLSPEAYGIVIVKPE
jgi:predicted Zn-dependent peptidase